MVLGTYSRASSRAARCLELLIAAGAAYTDSPALDVHRGRIGALAARLDAEPGLQHAPLSGLDYGITGGRALTATGGTLVHLATELCAVEVMRFLLGRGAAVDAPALRDAQGRGGQTPLFHAVAHYFDWGVATTALLLEHGADPNLVCTVRGSMHQPDAYFTGSAYDYARAFPPGREAGDPTLALLRRHGARERS